MGKIGKRVLIDRAALQASVLDIYISAAMDVGDTDETAEAEADPTNNGQSLMSNHQINYLGNPTQIYDTS